MICYERYRKYKYIIIMQKNKKQINFKSTFDSFQLLPKCKTFLGGLFSLSDTHNFNKSVLVKHYL